MFVNICYSAMSFHPYKVCGLWAGLVCCEEHPTLLPGKALTRSVGRIVTFGLDDSPGSTKNK
jgi:hypothetical protein